MVRVTVKLVDGTTESVNGRSLNVVDGTLRIQVSRASSPVQNVISYPLVNVMKWVVDEWD